MSKIEELIQQYCPDGVEYKTLGEIAKLSRGKVYSKDYLRDNVGEYPVFSSQTANNGELGRINTFDYDGEYLTWTTDGAYAGTIFKRKGKFSITNVCGLIDVLDSQQINISFLYYWLSFKTKDYVYSGMGNPKLMSNVMATISIPLPPLPVQEEIVRILDKFTTLEAELEAELDCRKRQYEYYRDKLLNKSKSENEYKRVKLGEIGRVCMCKRVLKEQTTNIGDIPFYKIGTFGKEADAFISKELYEDYKSKYSFPKKGDVLISASGTIGRSVIYDGKPAYYQDSNIVWIENDESKALNKWLFYCYQMSPWKVSTGGTISRLYNDNIANAEIPLPPLAVQERVVNVLDNFEQLCNDLGIGLPAEIEARKKQYEYYRNKLLTFTPPITK